MFRILKALYVKMSNGKSFDFPCDFEVLYLTVINNVDYFYFIRNKYPYANKFVSQLRLMLCHLQWYQNNLRELYDEAPYYDFRSGTHGNGYRTFLLIFERLFSECYEYSKKLCCARNSLFFRPVKCLKEAESLVSILDGLRPGLKYIKQMIEQSQTNRYLMADKFFTAEELVKECGALNQLGFYGQYQGFYYCTSMRRILQGVGVIMATFSDLYQNPGGPLSKAVLTILNGIKYILSPELRAQQIVDVAQNSSVEFLKAFWSLSDLHFMKQLPSWVCPKLEVRKEIFIPPESIHLSNVNSDDLVVIPAPSSHISPAPVRCLLLSAKLRKGQNSENQVISSHAELSKNLLFHCHGGGFISQNPESHEIYLRNWAHDLNIPILSVDYTLSPEAPFPRALEEVLLAYAWTLTNAEKLGWTGERIYFAGDSAGGNVLMGIVLKTIALNIRQPNAVLCAYTPLVLDLVPSPSRLLCWLDPLLPLGFMISCLDAYAGDMQTDGAEYDEDVTCGTPAPKSRKVSSISEIFDSSLMFLKQPEWVEVEANEPCPSDLDLSSFEHEPQESMSSLNNYVSCLLKDHIHNIGPSALNEDADDDHSIFSFPQDVAFDIKAKCKVTAWTVFSKVSETIICSPFYQKFISPFVPYPKFPGGEEKSSFGRDSTSSILQKIRKLKIVSRNPFMSPLLASDDSFKHMPPIYFVSLNFDPCLDDSIQFAKRLASFDRHVVLDVLDGLPHGFLNFLPFSHEAHNGSNLCVRRLKEAMKLF